MIITFNEKEERKADKSLNSYQKGAISKIFDSFENSREDYHLLYQLPTGGGKTVIFQKLLDSIFLIIRKKY